MSAAHHAEKPNNGVLKQLLARREEFLEFTEKRVDSREGAEDLLQSAFVGGVRSTFATRREQLPDFIVCCAMPLLITTAPMAASSVSSRSGLKDSTYLANQKSLSEICRCVARVLDEIKPEHSEALRIVMLPCARIMPERHCEIESV